MKKHQERHGRAAPLDGIKVLDFTRAMAGPFCTMMLGDQGADIIKVEPPEGDETRAWGPPFLKQESTYFLSVNRNKKSIVLDLKKEKGIEVVKRLVATSNVLVENYRPGTTAKLGIDYEEMRKFNEALVYCSISGFGQTGPDREKPGYDIIALATSGMMSITGEEGRPPVKVGVPISDICAGMYAAFAIASFLCSRGKGSSNTNRARKGTYIDVSMLEGQISWLTHQASSFFVTNENPKPLGSAHPSIAPYQAFVGSDGEYFIVAVGNDELWRRFCSCIRATQLANDAKFATNSSRVAHRFELAHELEKIFSTEISETWLGRISSAGVPCAPINKLDRVFRDPQVISRRAVLDSEHPKCGRIKQVAPPYRYDDLPFAITSPPPLLGQHTIEILLAMGYSPRDIKGLQEEQVVFSNV